MRTALWIVGTPIALFILWALVRTPSPEENERWSDKKTIESCWELQSRKSLEPSVARGVASTCEGMEAKFLQKWGNKP